MLGRLPSEGQTLWALFTQSGRTPAGISLEVQRGQRAAFLQQGSCPGTMGQTSWGAALPGGPRLAPQPSQTQCARPSDPGCDLLLQQDGLRAAGLQGPRDWFQGGGQPCGQARAGESPARTTTCPGGLSLFLRVSELLETLAPLVETQRLEGPLSRQAQASCRKPGKAIRVLAGCSAHWPLCQVPFCPGFRSFLVSSPSPMLVSHVFRKNGQRPWVSEPEVQAVPLPPDPRDLPSGGLTQTPGAQEKPPVPQDQGGH